MNLVLDTLKSSRSLMLVGHALGLLATAGLVHLAFPSGQILSAALMVALILGIVEVVMALTDQGARRLRVLAPGVFPLKNLAEPEREFVQKSLLELPRRSAWRCLLAWSLVYMVMVLNNWGIWALACVTLGMPVSIFAQLLGNTVMGRRVAPFYYFEGDTPDQLSRHMPTLQGRMSQWLVAPLILLVAFPMAFAAKGIKLPLYSLIWLLAWAIAAIFDEIRVFKDMVVSPIEDLGQALGRLGEGDFGALLDVTSGDILGVTTNRYNKTVRKIDRRFFVQENFGHMVTGEKSEQLFEGGLKLDGEEREVAVLACRIKGEVLTFTAFNKFCNAVAECVDKHGGCVDEVSQGLVVALFNAPLKIENAESEGMEAAKEIRSALEVFRAQQKMQIGLKFQIGVGFAYGKAVLGLVGPKGRQRYTALGQVVEDARSQSFL